MKKLYIHLLVAFIFINTAVAQTLAYYQSLHIDTLYKLTGYPEAKQIAFYFPAYADASPRSAGYAAQSVESRWILTRRDTSRVGKTLLKATVFAQNVGTIRVYWQQNSQRRFLGRMQPAADGFQLDLQLSLDSVREQAADSILINMAYEPRDAHKPARLVVGDLFISCSQIQRSLSPLDLFQQAPFSNPHLSSIYQSHAFDSYGVYAYFPASYSEEEFKGSLVIEDHTIASNELVGRVILSAMKHYPFYQEKQLDKLSVTEQAKTLIDRCQLLSTCAFTDSLNQFIEQIYKDPHFRIRTNCPIKKLQTPVYLYPIKGKYYVAAVLDEALKQQIPLGAEVLSINRTPLTSLPQPISSKAVDRLLKAEPSVIMELIIRWANEIRTVSYTTHERYSIPSGFWPRDLQLRYLNDSIAYYKINKISTTLPIDFINKLDSINERQKLILDLRGNGGGDIIEAARFASFFINKPFKYYDLLDIQTGRVDSVMVGVNPSSYHFRGDGKIVLLIDESTSCAAELLTAVLRKYFKNLVIVGKAATGGVIAYVFEMILSQCGIVISTNSLEKGKILIDGKVMEGIGIRPDVLVDIATITDLQPYEDLVLQTAISK